MHCRPAAFLLVTVLSLVLLSCNSNRFFHETKRIPDGIWNTENRISFDLSIPDTSKRFLMFIDIRHDVEYPFANIYMFLDTRFPDGKIARDTIECQLADYDGRWLGSGSGSIRFNRFRFQKGIRFTRKGNYSFTFEQAMRKSRLNGIRDIGIELETEQ
jgi:gliding motility-associated lipoprotein GldH